MHIHEQKNKNSFEITINYAIIINGALDTASNTHIMDTTARAFRSFIRTNKGCC